MYFRNLRTLLLAALFYPLLSGCATEGSERVAEERDNPCRPNRTYVCVERAGKSEECRCLRDDDMRDIFDMQVERH